MFTSPIGAAIGAAVPLVIVYCRYRWQLHREIRRMPKATPIPRRRPSPGPSYRPVERGGQIYKSRHADRPLDPGVDTLINSVDRFIDERYGVGVGRTMPRIPRHRNERPR